MVFLATAVAALPAVMLASPASAAGEGTLAFELACTDANGAGAKVTVR